MTRQMKALAPVAIFVSCMLGACASQPKAIPQAAGQPAAQVAVESPLPAAPLPQAAAPAPVAPPPPWAGHERECEYPDEATVGQMIYRSNASGTQVHGQFGAAEVERENWPAKPGFIKYPGIDLPDADHLFLRVWYSKHSPASTAILIHLDDEADPRASFVPRNQGDWDKFTQTEAIDLGKTTKGVHSIKFSTEGQRYGVADLDRFTLSAQ